MTSSSETLAIQGEAKPLMDYSRQHYASLDSAKSEPVSEPAKAQKPQKCAKVLLVLLGVFCVATVIAVIITLPIVFSGKKHHESSLSPVLPDSANFTLIEPQGAINDSDVLVKLTSDWRALNYLTDGEENDEPKVMLRANAKSPIQEENTDTDIFENFETYNDTYNTQEEPSSESSGEEPEEPTGADKVEIKTKFGKLVGLVKKSRQGKDYFAFLKVPYATAPIGKRRFKTPFAQSSWTRTLDATVPPPLCIQKRKYSAIDEAVGEEDCLYMSIYTPKLPSASTKWSDLYPVMFYIHGGGFTDGNGFRYGADYFMDENVVLITFQYRLGPFGFLNTKDGDILGNMGFKDQVEALKFVRKIIRDFHGDADRTTIFGNSAGAQSVSFHLVSPMSKGLFSRAIAQSGNAVAAFNIDQNPEVTAKIVAEKFNCTGRRTFRKRKLSDCLRDVAAADLALVRPLQARYMATIEEPAADPFLTDLPLNLMRNGKINRVPLITGVNSAEGLPQTLIFLATPLLSKLLNENWAFVAPLLFQFNSSAFNKDALSFRVREFFFGDRRVDNDTLSNLTALCSDRMFGHTTAVVARYHAEVSPVYLYYLTKRPAKSYSDKNLQGWPPGNYGVAHADELQYLFLYDGYPPINTTSEYFNFSANLVKTWAKFGADGKPEDEWLQYRPKWQENWRVLDDRRSMTDALVARMQLWDSYSAQDLSYEP